MRASRTQGTADILPSGSEETPECIRWADYVVLNAILSSALLDKGLSMNGRSKESVNNSPASIDLNRQVGESPFALRRFAVRRFSPFCQAPIPLVQLDLTHH